jgi:hypothetical protein
MNCSLHPKMIKTQFSKVNIFFTPDLKSNKPEAMLAPYTITKATASKEMGQGHTNILHS